MDVFVSVLNGEATPALMDTRLVSSLTGLMASAPVSLCTYVSLPRQLHVCHVGHTGGHDPEEATWLSFHF